MNLTQQIRLVHVSRLLFPALLTVLLGGLVGLGEQTALSFLSVAIVACPMVFLVLVAPRYALYLSIVFLPLYLLTLVLLYALHIPPETIRAVQRLKEVLIIVAAIGIVVRILQRPIISRPQLLDWIVIAFLCLNFLYLFFPGQTSDIVRLAGLRANSFFFITYFLGRAVALGQHGPKTVISLLAFLGVMTGLSAIFEKLFLDPAWLLDLGYTHFLIDFYNGANVHDAQALPWTFWTEGFGYRRVSGFFANPLDLAASTPITGAALLALFFAHTSRYRYWSLFALAILSIGLLLSLSRMAIMTFPLMLAVISLSFRKRAAVVVIGFLTVSALLFITLMFQEGWIGRFIMRTLTFENASSQGHTEAWNVGLQAIWNHPWGLGLGTSGAIGNRFGSSIGGENQYITIGVELGWIGMLLYTATIVLALWTCWHLIHKTDNTSEKILGAAGLGAAIGLGILGLTAQIGIYLFPTFVGWWIIGFAHSTLQRLRRKGVENQTFKTTNLGT